MDTCLPSFDICQGTVAPNCFKSHTNTRCPDLFQKKKFCLMSGLNFTLSDVTSFSTEVVAGRQCNFFYPHFNTYKTKNVYAI